ncbi:MAG: hypothetical protein ACRDSP_01590 [Pseudonocardiaceae bacterium]
MTATNGHNTGHETGKAAVTESRPVVLLRYRPGLAPETARVVHLVPLPDGTGAVSALCGALLSPQEYETVPPGYGMPCSECMISHTQHGDPPPPDTPETTPGTGPTPNPTSPDTGPRAAALGYRAWGWPVTQHGNQVRLSVDGDVVALLVPSLLAAEVTAILARRHCAPAVLTHPYTPQHRILLCGERFGTALPWPPDIHQITATLLLPPTMTPQGPLDWVHPPVPDSLRLCREIDILAAVRVALRDPPPASGPMHF